MNRRETTMGLAALGAAPLPAVAQQAAKVARLGIPSSTSGVNSYTNEAFRQGLRELGYVDGRNVLIEARNAEGKVERLPTLAAELVINLKTAKSLGLTVPQSVLLRADKMIE